jgi:hypothetical protein
VAAIKMDYVWAKSNMALINTSGIQDSHALDKAVSRRNPTKITELAELLISKMAAANFEAAIALIDEAHSEDPSIVTINGKEIPYELHYAQKSTHYLGLREPDASPVLKTAVRAQHFRR